jgi:hypothetical protein
MEARKMLKGEGKDSQIVKLTPHHSKLKEIRDLELPEEVLVRFVRVTLKTGEYEVLVTSLLDEPVPLVTNTVLPSIIFSPDITQILS